MTKSRTLRKAGAVVLSLAMAASTLFVAPDSFAAKKVTLSATEGTVKVKKTKKVTIKGTTKKNIKKVKFAHSKKGIAKATRSGLTLKYKGLKEGKTTITNKITLKAKVGKKKQYNLKYKLTVKAAAVAVADVKIDNTTPKVDDTLKASAVDKDGNALSGATYEWFTNDTAATTGGTSAGTGASLAITEAMIGKYVYVTATLNGATVTSAATNAVLSATAADVTLEYSLKPQADGSFLESGNITLNIGSATGTPKSITWYKDEKVFATYGSGNSAIQAAAFTQSSAGKGTWYAEVTTTDLGVYKSNSLTLVSDEVPATLTGWSITEDYSKDSANVTLADKTTNYVATIKMNYDYEGNFWIVPAEETSYVQSKMVNTTTAALDFDGVSTNSTIVSVKSEEVLTEENTLAGTAKIGDKAGSTATNTDNAIKYVADDGSVTYMFKINSTAGLTRGKSYKLIFDQKKLEEGHITNVAYTDGKTAGETTNAPNITEAALAPYVHQVDGIAITTKQTATNVAGWKASLYNGSEVATYIQAADESDGIAIDLYTNTALSTTGGTKFTTDNTAITNGVTATANLKGGAADYAYATFAAPAGIFGADKVSLTSAVVEPAISILSSVEATVSTTDAKDIEVTTHNVKADAKIYLLTATYTTSKAGTAAAAVTGFDAADPKTYVAVESVTKGQGSVTFNDVIKKVTDTTHGDEYTFVVVPNDDVNYTKYEVDGTTNTGNITVSQTATTYSLTGTLTGLKVAVNDTANTTDAYLKAQDQYGNDMDVAILAGGAVPTGATHFVKFSETSVDQSFVFGVAASATPEAGGRISIKTTDDGGPVGAKKGDYYYYKLAAGYFLTFTCTKDGASNTATWTASLESTVASN